MNKRKRSNGLYKAVRSAKRVARLVKASSTRRTGGFGNVAVLSRYGERKYIDNNSSNGALAFTVSAGFPATGTIGIQLINGCATGTLINTRVGRRITMKSCRVRIIVQPAPTTTSGFFGYAIVLDRQPNGAVIASPNDVWQDLATVVANPGNLTPWVTPTNLSNVGRFEILKKVQVPIIGGVTVNGDSNVQKRLKFTRVWRRGVPVQFNAGITGTVGDIQTNALYLMTWTTCGSAIPLTAYSSRVSFTDS